MRTVSSTRTASALALAVKDAMAKLEELERELGISAPTLSPVQKKHTARFRKGGDKVIATLANVATQSGTTVGALPVSEMTDLLAMADSIVRLRQCVGKLDGMLGSFVFTARATAWSTAMHYYALLQRMAKRNGEIAKTLEPVKKFMSVHDPRPKRAVGDASRSAERAVKKAQRTLAGAPKAVVEQVDAEMAARAAKKKKGG
jgi:hypothetical protein